MICPNCDTDYSDTVIKLHIKRCVKQDVINPSNDFNELKKKGKKLKIKSWHLMSEDKLKEAIVEAEKGDA